MSLSYEKSWFKIRFDPGQHFLDPGVDSGFPDPADPGAGGDDANEKHGLSFGHEASTRITIARILA